MAGKHSGHSAAIGGTVTVFSDRGFEFCPEMPRVTDVTVKVLKLRDTQ